MSGIVRLVSDSGGEATIAAHVLAAASPSVWAERFAISTTKHGVDDVDDPEADDVRSYEKGMSSFELSSFVGVATLLSPHPTLPDLLERPRRGSIAAHLQVRRFTAALSLCHKYACDGLVKLIAYLVDYHFPPTMLPEPKDDGQNHLARARAAEVSGSDESRASASLTPMAQWITQSHIDFIVRAQVMTHALLCTR